ncbi:MAG: ATP-grasp domain-containing protein [Candidatus Thorarchaeota archaeon]
MRKLKVVLTACGCPGASTLIHMLKRNGERPIEVIGTDMDEEAVGRFLTERFYKVPPGDSPEYIPRMLEIIEKEKPDVLFPESSNEVLSLALNKEKIEGFGTKVLVSDPEPIELSNNKYRMYERLHSKTKIILPRYISVSSLDEFLNAAEKLGYPENPVIFKPHIGKGSRGVRIIDSRVNRRQHLMEKKPSSKYISLEEIQTIFSNQTNFPKLLLMEFIEGMERTTDTLALEGRELLTTVKTVEQARWGVIVRGELVQQPALVEQTRAILKAIPLSYCVNLQFIEDKLIEINPRVSTFIYQSDLIAPYLAIRLALGELTEEDVRRYKTKIDYGRRMVRYMDQLFHKGGRRIE